MQHICTTLRPTTGDREVPEIPKIMQKEVPKERFGLDFSQTSGRETAALLSTIDLFIQLGKGPTTDAIISENRSPAFQVLQSHTSFHCQGDQSQPTIWVLVKTDDHSMDMLNDRIPWRLQTLP